MKTLIALALVAGMVAPAATQTAPKANRLLTQEEKVEALKMAYRLNGNSMNGGNRMIDLTDPKVLEDYARLVATDLPEMPLIYPPPATVRTIPIKPTPPLRFAAIEPAPKADICRRHGMRRVETNGGRSWRCRR
jgi:hypothetical protein